MPVNVQAVLFDFGMVLSAPPNTQAWEDMKSTAGLDEGALHEQYWKWRDDYDRGALSGIAYWRRIGSEAGRTFDDAAVGCLIALDVQLWTDINTPMLLWATALQDAGIRTGILSNIGDAMAEGIRSKFDWVGRFHTTVWSHEHNLKKPDAEIYRIAAEGLQTPPAKILFVDDREENIEGAIRAGMQGVVYRNQTQFEQEMRELGLSSLLQPASHTQTVG